MNDQLRIVAFDLDGTVLDNGKMSPAVRTALLALRKSGVAVVVATGRDIAQISPEIISCFSHTIAANGAYVIDNTSGRFLRRSAIPPDTAFDAVRIILDHRGGPTLFLCGKMLSSLRSPLLMPGASIKTYRKTAADYCPGLRLSPCLSIFAKSRGRSVYKIQGFFKSTADCAAAADELRHIGKLEALDIGNCTVEVTSGAVTKASALKELCGLLGFGINELAAFGDSRNDLDMLCAAGFAVAMANGDDCIKDVADYIAGDVSADGAAAAIYDIFDLEPEIR